MAESKENEKKRDAVEALKNFYKRHKKLSWTVGSIVVLLVIVRIFLGQIVQTSVAALAPKIAGVPVSIGDVSISVFSGYVELKDVKVGNPEGFGAEHMVTLKHAVFDIDLGSLFSDKIRIEEITVTGLDLYYEQKLTTNNVATLQANVEKNLGAEKAQTADAQIASEEEEGTAEEAPQPQKLQVDKIAMNEMWTHVVIAGADVPVPIIPINMENLGTGPEGITGMEVFAEVLNKLSFGVTGAVAEALKNAGGAATDVIEGAGEGIKKIFGN